MKIILICNSCNKKTSQEVEFVSDINWKCSKCGSDKDTFISNIDSGEYKPLGVGRGGCGPNGFK